MFGDPTTGYGVPMSERARDNKANVRTVICIDCGATRPTRDMFDTEHGPVCDGECQNDQPSSNDSKE